MGRTPIDDSLKSLRGTNRQRPPTGLSLPVEAPDPPPTLSPEARAEWDRVVSELSAVGLMSRLDRAALTAYCECWAAWVDARARLSETGVIDGDGSVSPWFRVMQQLERGLRAWAGKLGLSPASRRQYGTIQTSRPPGDKAKFFD